MACIVNLFESLGGTPDTGGNWFFASAGPITFDYGVCPDAATEDTFSEGDQVGTGHTVCVDLTGVPAGSYVFTYVVPDGGVLADCGGSDCVGCSEITITIQESPVNGAPVEYCENDMGSYNLYDLLGNNPSTNGNWAVSVPLAWTEGQSNDDLGTNDFFKPSDLGPGVFTFTYTVNSDVECTNCSATVEVTIIAGSNPGEDAEVFICV